MTDNNIVTDIDAEIAELRKGKPKVQVTITDDEGYVVSQFTVFADSNDQSDWFLADQIETTVGDRFDIDR